MKNFFKWTCVWCFTQIRDGNIIWKFENKNLLTTIGGKAITDVFLRSNDAPYFQATNFYIGLYAGSVSKATTIATIPGEPSGNGYSRPMCERSSTGWPTIELDDAGDYRFVSKEMSITASGGSIGPIDGGFLCTSIDNSGTLIGIVAMDVRRTLLAGDTMILQLKAKIS